MTDWRPDVLGEGWEARTLPLRPDNHGPAVATLVRRVRRPEEPATGRAVLYVHGFVDYFFQRHVGDACASLGYDFVALDLRSHGRSIRPHRLPNYVPDLALHAEELDAAVRLLRADHDVVVGMGHSTGGLLLSMWAHARRARPGGSPVDALVLNSPWFELNRPPVRRALSTLGVSVVARVAPTRVVGGLRSGYGPWLHDPDGGGWDYDQRWKPDGGFPARASWTHSVRRAHAAVRRGLDVAVPVLVCASDATGPSDRPHDALDRTDSVLDVDHVVQRAPRLGPDVTVVQIPGGVHDLALSPEPARSRYLETVADWLTARLP